MSLSDSLSAEKEQKSQRETELLITIFSKAVEKVVSRQLKCPDPVTRARLSIESWNQFLTIATSALEAKAEMINCCDQTKQALKNASAILQQTIR